MKEPFFSIVTTAYNKEKYIKQCILSVLNQTFGDFEFIVVNDCSTDNTLNVLEEFKDDRIKIHNIANNRGVSFCRNYGLKNACGKYIYFIDSDDYLEETILKRAYEELCLNPSDMLIFPYHLYMETKKRVKRDNSKRMLKPIVNFKKPFCVQSSTKELLELSYEVWNKIFNRDFLCNSSIFFKEDLGFSEDLVFYCDILAHAKTATYLDAAGYYYRFFRKKKFNNDYVVEQFEKAFGYIKDTIVNKMGEEYYIQKVSSILNYWIIKLDYDKDLYNLALKLSKGKGIINIKGGLRKIFHKFYSKVKNIL